MEEKISGLVLGGVNFSENDKILNIFTLEKGVVSAKIKGVKKAGAKLKFASEPFCFAEFLFSTTASKRTVTGASLIDSFYPVREDIIKYFSAGAVLEFVKKFYRENIVSPEGFFTVINALKQIAYGNVSPLIPLIKFFLDALKEEGHAITLDGCFCCGDDIEGRIFFDYRYGGFFCQKCFDGAGREVSIVTFNALRKIMQGEEVDGEEIIKPLKLIDYYLENRAEETLTSLKELLKICN